MKTNEILNNNTNEDITICHNCNKVLSANDEIYSDAENDDKILCDSCSEFNELSNSYFLVNTVTHLCGQDVILYGVNNAVYETHENRINEILAYEITLEFNDSGSIKLDSGLTVDWQVLIPSLNKFIELSRNEKTIFEKDCLIYQIFLNCDGEYEYNIYNMIDLFPGDELDVEDGGILETKEAAKEFIAEILN